MLKQSIHPRLQMNFAIENSSPKKKKKKIAIENKLF